MVCEELVHKEIMTLQSTYKMLKASSWTTKKVISSTIDILSVPNLSLFGTFDKHYTLDKWNLHGTKMFHLSNVPLFRIAR